MYIYEPSIYRDNIRDHDLVSFQVNIKETDLYIKARSRLQSTAFKATLKSRTLLGSNEYDRSFRSYTVEHHLVAKGRFSCSRGSR
jgi:hypothetical protein